MFEKFKKNCFGLLTKKFAFYDFHTIPFQPSTTNLENRYGLPNRVALLANFSNFILCLFFGAHLWLPCQISTLYDQFRKSVWVTQQGPSTRKFFPFYVIFVVRTPFMISIRNFSLLRPFWKLCILTPPTLIWPPPVPRSTDFAHLRTHPMSWPNTQLVQIWLQ